MKYELQITCDDYKAAMRLHVTPRRRFKIVLYPLLAFLALAIFFTFKNLLAGEGRGFYMLAGGVAYLFLLFEVLLPYRWRKIYRQQKLLQKSFQYEFTADTFHTFSDYGNATLPWDKFHKWREGKNAFLVYQSDNLFHLIPKRIFESPEAQAQLRSYLTAKIGNPVT